jgi:hypothetical protein
MLIGAWKTWGTAAEAAPATDENKNNVGTTAHNDRRRFIDPTTPPLGNRPPQTYPAGPVAKRPHGNFLNGGVRQRAAEDTEGGPGRV